MSIEADIIELKRAVEAHREMLVELRKKVLGDGRADRRGINCPMNCRCQWLSAYHGNQCPQLGCDSEEI